MSAKTGVLVAVENEVTRRILVAQLESWGYRANAATSGEKAWDSLNNDGQVALLIADRAMQRSDGQELVRCSRSLQRRRYLHIILLTVQGAREDLLDIVDLGADAVLLTPYHPTELLAQIRVAERIITLEDRLADRLEELIVVHRRIKEDLRAAAHMQKSLLPGKEPDIPGVRFSWRYEACEQVAGDMFNVHRLDENRIGVYVLDVCGHGVQAALLSVTLSRMLSPLPQAGLLKRPVSTPPYYEITDPAEVARQCNQLFPLLGDTSFFFTLVYGVLDLSARRFTFVRAGHPGPVLIRERELETFERIDGIAIGVEPHRTYHNETIELLPGDRIFLRSDGIEEAINPDGEDFGHGRMRRHLLGAPGQSLDSVLDGLWKGIRDFRRGEPRQDDMTILGLELRAGG